MSQPQIGKADSTPSKTQARGRVTRAQLLLAFQLVVIVVLAYLIGERFTTLLHGTSATIGAIWCALTGITVFHTTRKDTWKEGTLQILGALIGAIISGLYLLLFPFSAVGLAISVSVTVMICQVSGLGESTKLAAASVVTIMVISSANPSLNPILNAALRFSEACIGAGIAIIVTFFSPALPAGDNQDHSS